MRIFYFGVYGNYGGLENFARNLVLSLRKKGIEFTLMTPAKKIAFEDDFLAAGCSIERLPDFKRHPFAYYKKFRQILKSAGPDDVVQLNICSYRNFLPLLACKKAHVKTIVAGHFANVADGRMPWMHYLNKRLYRKVGVKITMTDDISRFMFSKSSHPFKILNGIDTERFSYSDQARLEIRSQFHFDDGIAIGQISRIIAEKNPIFSVHAMEKVHEVYPNLTLHLIGREYDPSVREYIETKGLSYIHFDGEQKSGIEKWYSALDVLLLPSPKEGLSLALLESVGSGISLIASTAVPRLECPTPNISFLELDTEIWAKKIEELAASLPQRVNQIKGTPYDIEVCAAHYLDVYQNYSVYFPKYR